MTSTYRTVRKDLAEKMGTDPVCNRCQAAADRKTLSDHGGMCFGCFKSYSRTETPARGNYGIENGPRAWAHRLRAREGLGESLSSIQKAAWREVLHPTAHQGEAQ